MLRPIPCHLDRRVVPKPWGGRNLARVLGVELPGDEPIGETWEVYDRPDGASAVRGQDGITLADLLREDAAGWLGPAFAGATRFPLMIKFLDARERLSVQLHPDDAVAVGDSGKTEAWVVLDVGANGNVVRGLAPGCGRAELTAAIDATATDPSAMEAVLNGFRPAVGDAILVPAGTVHSIGPDVVVFEVQQNSDLTYRLYDWGRPRDLHTIQALDALRVDASPEPVLTSQPCPGGEWLIRHEMFTVRRFAVEAPLVVETEGAFKVLNVIGGQGTIGWRSGGDDPPLFARLGETVLVPAAVEQVFLSPVGRFEVLWTGPGERGMQ